MISIYNFPLINSIYILYIIPASSYEDDCPISCENSKAAIGGTGTITCTGPGRVECLTVEMNSRRCSKPSQRMQQKNLKKLGKSE